MYSEKKKTEFTKVAFTLCIQFKSDNDNWMRTPNKKCLTLLEPERLYISFEKKKRKSPPLLYQFWYAIVLFSSAYGHSLFCYKYTHTYYRYKNDKILIEILINQLACILHLQAKHCIFNKDFPENPPFSLSLKFLHSLLKF